MRALMSSTGSTVVISFYRLRNVVIVLLAIGLGVAVPQAASFVESLTLLIVTFLMYTSMKGTRLTPTNAPRYLFPILGVLAITYVAVPLFGISWARYLLTGESLVGIAVVLSAPATAGSAIVWTRSSSGNDELSGLTSASTIVAAPLLTPILLAHLLDQQVRLPTARLELELLFIIIASLALLVLLPDSRVDERTIDFGSQTSILLLIYAGVGTAGLSEISAPFLLEIGLTAIAISVIGLAATFGVATVLDLDSDDFLAVYFSGTLKNLGIAILVVLSFASDGVLLTVITFYVSQQVLSALVVDGWLFAS